MPSLESQAQRIADAYQPPPIGRPAGITDTPALQELLHQIRQGNYFATACRIAGIAERTAYDWLKRGDAGEEAYSLFSQAVKNAEAMAEAQDVANVRAAGKAGPQYWAASMTYLERKYPDRWGKRPDDSSGPKVIVQIGVKDSDVQVQVLSTGLNPLPSALDQGNHNASYQTQMLGETQAMQPLTAPYCGANEAKVEGER